MSGYRYHYRLQAGRDALRPWHWDVIEGALEYPHQITHQEVKLLAISAAPAEYNVFNDIDIHKVEQV